ncbi:MAG: hypothetical protein L6R48_01455 [Planctomycetes bacterium]|nr:hypothetical protein [Planctomycetota bacterium]
MDAGTELAVLRRRWAEAWQADQEREWSASAAAAAEDQAARQRLQRQLRERYGIDADPGLDLAALQRLRATAEAERQAQAAGSGRPVAAEPRPAAPRGRVALADQPGERPVAAPATPATPATPAVGGRGAAPTVKTLRLDAPGVDHASLRSGGKTSVCVQFGQERATEFHGVFATLHRLLEASPPIPDAVFLLGHGQGSTIAGVSIDQHLRANKAFYETFGGTRPARPLACLVIASCSAGSADQMAEMRDGLGYYPTWRVGTWSRSYANAISVIGAFEGIANRPAAPSWRGLFLTGRADGSPASLGEVGVGGERGNLVYVDLVEEAGKRAWKQR